MDKVNLKHEVCACAVHGNQTILDGPDMVTFWTKYAKVRYMIEFTRNLLEILEIRCSQ